MRAPPPDPVLFALVAVLGLTHVVAAQNPRQTPRAAISSQNVIAVRVELEGGGQPPGLVRLELLREEMPLEEAYCDSRGRYTFRGLEDGGYSVRIILPGYEPQLHTVELNGGSTRQIVARLRAERNAVPTANTPPTVSAEWLAVPEEARKEFEQARELRAQGDCKRAVKHLQRALELHAPFSEALNDLGLCCRQLGQLDKAREALESALRLNPALLAAYLNLADVHLARRDVQAAARTLLHASRTFPRQGEPYFAMANIQFNGGQLERAEQACVLAIEREHSKVPEVHLLRANIYSRRKDWHQMAVELEEYLREAPAGEYAADARGRLEGLRKEQSTGARAPAGRP